MSSHKNDYNSSIQILKNVKRKKFENFSNYVKSVNNWKKIHQTQNEDREKRCSSVEKFKTDADQIFRTPCKNCAESENQ